MPDEVVCWVLVVDGIYAGTEEAPTREDAEARFVSDGGSPAIAVTQDEFWEGDYSIR